MRVVFARKSLPDGWSTNIGLGLLAIGLGISGGLSVVLLPNPLLGFGVILGLMLGSLMIAHPVFTLGMEVGVCCLLPFAVIPVKTGFLTFTLLETTLLILFLVWLLQWATGKRPITGPFDWAILLFAGLSIFSYILNWQTASSSDLIHRYAKLMLAILQFFAVINIVQTQAALDSIMRVLIWAGSLAGYLGAGLTRLPRDLQENLLGRLQVVGYPTERILRYVEDDPLKPQRATGTSIDPNSYGGMLALIIALLVTQLASSRPLLPRWLLAVLLPGPTIALYLTQGRGALILGAMATVAFIATVKYRKIWAYLAPFILGGAIWLPSSFLGNRIAQGFALQDQATLMRLDEYQNALAIIGRYPFFGVGFGTSPAIDLTVGASMIYLTIAEEMGLIGLGCFLLIMGLFFGYTLGNLNRLPDPRQQANLLGLTGGIVGALGAGSLDHYFFTSLATGDFTHMTALFWLFLGLAIAQTKIGALPQSHD